MNQQRILITGGARRLGKKLSEHFLGLGWQVVAHFNTSSELTAHPNLELIQANLAHLDDIDQLCAALVKQGKFDAVIHNASCFVADGQATDVVEHIEQH